MAELGGRHLTPVFIRVSAADIASNAEVSGIPLGDFLDERGEISFGDESAMNELVSVLSEWLVPSKKQPRLLGVSRSLSI